MKLKSITLALSLVAACFTAGAQTNSLLGDLKTGAEDIGSSTNWAVYATGGHSLTKQYYLAGIGVAYNITPHVAPLFGIDERFNGKTHVFSSVSGGLEFQLPIQPLQSLGITNLWLITYAGDLAASGSGGTSVGNIALVGADVDIYNFSAWSIQGGVDYENCSGQGVYGANYLLGHMALTHDLPEGIPLVLRVDRTMTALRHGIGSDKLCL